jgi:vacuolar protein sorting-associated protein 29
MDVDVLISGHTHQFESFEYDGRFFVNPGSATGAFSTLDNRYSNKNMLWCFQVSTLTLRDVCPSFVLLDINEDNLVAYVYKYQDNQVQVEKMDYKKPN